MVLSWLGGYGSVVTFYPDRGFGGGVAVDREGFKSGPAVE